MAFRHGRKQLQVENIGVGTLYVRVRNWVRQRQRVSAGVLGGLAILISNLSAQIQLAVTCDNFLVGSSVVLLMDNGDPPQIGLLVPPNLPMLGSGYVPTMI
jgi:hypothetical protein